ncbi:tetratricopeptide repeat protein, partial [Thermodesulfobacteriota bacterium]
MDTNRADKAAEEYKKVIDLDPSDKWLLMEVERRLAELAMSSGKIEKAIDIYDDLIKRYSGDPQSIINLYMNKINLYRQNNRGADAKKTLDEAIALTNGRGDLEAQLLVMQAQIHMEEGNLDEAGAVYQKVLKRKGAEQWATCDAERGLAEIALNRNQVDEAVEIYSGLIEKYSETPQFLMNLYEGMVNAKIKAGRQNQAINICKEGIDKLENYPDDLARLFFMLGNIYMDTNRADKAAEEYKKVIDMKINDRWVVHEAKRRLEEMNIQ